MSDEPKTVKLSLYVDNHLYDTITVDMEDAEQVTRILLVDDNGNVIREEELKLVDQ